MGFGGINAHIVVEGLGNIRRQNLTPKERQLIHSRQDAELILLSANSEADLKQKIDHLLTITPRLSLAEIGDLAGELAHKVEPNLPLRVAIVASNPQELTTRLQLTQQLVSGEKNQQSGNKQDKENIFIGRENKIPRVGFLFPGQASPVYLDGGIWQRRFREIEELYHQAELPTGENNLSTEIAQPAIVTSSLAGLKILDKLNIKANIAIGHSLGELCSLYWANTYDSDGLISLAKHRGQGMAQLGSATGKMASIQADADTVQALIKDREVVISGINSPSQTIISGEEVAAKNVINQAQAQGLKTVLLPVSHAFHSPLVSKAIPPLEDYLQHYHDQYLQKSIISTVTGKELPLDINWKSLLLNQVTSPVRFLDAVNEAKNKVDLFIEVGSGNILSRLVSNINNNLPVISLDSGGESLQGLLKTVGALFAWGGKVDYQFLFAEKFNRPFNLDWQPNFLVNPCEKNAPLTQENYDLKSDFNIEGSTNHKQEESLPSFPSENQPLTVVKKSDSIIDTVKELVAQKTDESALSLAKATGVKLALLGRSHPEYNQELAQNLQRIKDIGVQFAYFPCDVSDEAQVKQTITKIESQLGKVTGILHGAGVNIPKLIPQLELTDFYHTLAPKVKGLQHILTNIKADSLKVLITFGSIIARTGLVGEADYGLANEWLGRIVEKFQGEHPHCRCLNLEWSVWSGIGMGERLGRVDTLLQQGITPIPPDTGIQILHSLLNQSLVI